MMRRGDTIYAPATAPGRAGVAVIRLSGPNALLAVELFAVPGPLQPRLATFASFKYRGLLVDKGLVIHFPAPRSFTGEDILELHIHGGRAIQSAMLAAIATLPDCRPAEAGEFAQRAFFNGKMDLAEAEGLADLIDAETERQRQQAMIWMEGAASDFYTTLRQRILEPLAWLEAYIDFPDEDIPESVEAEVADRIAVLCKDIETLMSDTGGERLREGFTVVLLGPPNSGKSTLLNTLAQRNVAIVSNIAGTTRDIIEVQLDLDGLPVRIIDTAGLRDSQDSIELEGMQRAITAAERADLCLFLHSVDTEPPGQVIEAKAIWHIATKVDIGLPNKDIDVAISADDDYSIRQLLVQLSDYFGAKITNESQMLTRQRHRISLVNALIDLQSYDSRDALEIRCESLRSASVDIGMVVGGIHVDDLLDAIFSRFCIGK